MKVMPFRMTLASLLFLAGGAGVQAAEGDTLPPPISTALEGRKGICLVLNCGEGKVAVAVAKGGELFVCALAKDEKDCEAARQNLDQAGVYGSRATALVSSHLKIPLPNGYANLIVVGEIPDGLDFKEIKRVLNPNGVVVIGDGRSDVAKLKDLAAKSGIADAKVDGSYLVIAGRMPEGSDDWTHMHGGPDNHRVSADVSIRPPFRTQWLDARTAWMVAAKGRLLMKGNGRGPENRRPGWIDAGIYDRILVQDGMNGTTLWERKNTIRDRAGSLMFSVGDTVMAGDKVYTIETNAVIVLDAATGRELATIRTPAGSEDECAVFHRMAFQDGRLYVVASKAPVKYLKYYGTPTTQSTADRLVAFDAGSGRLLWTYSCDKRVFDHSLALGPTAAYLLLEGGGAVAVDLKTGKQSWRNEEVRYGQGRSSFSTVYHDGKVSFWPDPGVVVDAAKGTTLYKAPCQFFIGARAYSGPGKIKVFDLATGKEEEAYKISPGSGTCGPNSGTPSCVAEGGTFYGFESKRCWSLYSMRLSCDAGLNYANGLAYVPYACTLCNCMQAMQGTIVLAPTDEWDLPKPADASHLYKGRVAHAVSAQSAADAWPQYRKDSHRSAVATNPVSLLAGKGWQCTLDGKLTPAVIAGGMVFVGSDRAKVWGISDSGKVAWVRRLGCGIAAAPAYWRGRLLVGGTDGWLRCLKADTGEPIWSFQAAPMERYIAFNGHVISAWPIFSEVATDDANVYLVAGVTPYDGSYLYSMEIASGKLNWAMKIDASPFGSLVTTDDLVIVPCGGAWPFAFSKKDGKVVWSVDTTRWTSFSLRPTGGGDVMVQDDVLLRGGRRLMGGSYMFRSHYAASGHDYYNLPGVDKAEGFRKDPKWSSEYGPPFDLGIALPVIAGKACYWISKEPRQPDTLVALRRDMIKELNMSKDKAKALESAKIWSTTAIPAGAHSIAVAGSQVLVAGTSEVVVLDGTEPRELARFKVDGKIVLNGLAVAHGRAYVATEEGRLVCLGVDNGAGPPKGS